MVVEPPPHSMDASSSRPSDKSGAQRLRRPIEQPHVACASRAEAAMPAGETGQEPGRTNLRGLQGITIIKQY
jgi:hypothetical protein